MSDLQPARVLLVDDEPHNLAMVSDVLESGGYVVDTTTSPETALRRVAAVSFDAAVFDLCMPGMDGLMLAERVHELSPHTQVIILTGHGDLESVVASLQHGIFDYLQKGNLDVTRLEGAVRSAVAKARLLREREHLTEDLRRSARLLEALNQVAGGGAAHGLGLEWFLARVVEAARHLSGAATVRVLLFEREPGDRLVVRFAGGDGAGALVGVRLRAGEGLAGQAARGQQSFRLQRPGEHAAYSDRCDEVPGSSAGWVCVPVLHGSVLGALTVAGRAAAFTAEDQDDLERLAAQAALGLENVLSNERAGNFFTHMSQLLVSILDSSEPDYAGHSLRVAHLSDMMSRRLGLSDKERRDIHFGALLHDVGKLKLTPGALHAGAGEAGRVRDHAQLAVDLLKPITAWHDMLPIIQAHHERWDGTGYPLGLSGEDIPLGARIVGIAEAFDAMTRCRTRAPQRTREAALAEVQACAGSQFDPRLVRLFVAECEKAGDTVPEPA